MRGLNSYFANQTLELNHLELLCEYCYRYPMRTLLNALSLNSSFACKDCLRWRSMLNPRDSQYKCSNFRKHGNSKFEFYELALRLKSANNRFQLSALTLNTILSGINHI